MTLEVVQEKLTVGKGCDADRSLQDLLYRTELSTKTPSRLPGRYLGMAEEEMHRRIAAARAELGSRLAILGHHYQRDEIIRYADFRGDSFKLARSAAAHPEADYIIFCGVHFMAESADVLSGPHQKVILPNLSAGCSMADMAPTEDVFACWEELQAIEGVAGTVTPVTYMNSTAALKAFCGVNGGVVCTSSNAAAVVEWALAQSAKVLFFPDQHLGRNTAVKMGYSPDDTVVWDPFQPLGGQHRGGAPEGNVHSVAGPLLGAQALHRGADRRRPQELPRRERHRPPRVRAGSGPDRRLHRLDGAHHRDGRRGARRRRLGRGHRDQPREPASPPSTPTRPSSASTRSSVPARRCTASTPPTWPG